MNKKEVYTYGICFYRDEKDYYKKFRKILKALKSLFLDVTNFDNYGSFYFEGNKIVYKISPKPFYWIDLDEDIKLLEKITRIKDIMIYKADSEKVELIKKDNKIYRHYFDEC